MVIDVTSEHTLDMPQSKEKECGLTYKRMGYGVLTHVIRCWCVWQLQSMF